MIKKAFSFLVISTLFFVGCTNQNKEAESTENNISLTTSFNEKTETPANITLSGKTLTYNKYVHIGDLLFFPDSSNNNKLSVAKIPENKTTVSKDLITDTFDYSVDSLVSDNDSLYFTSNSGDSGLYKLDYQKKNVIKINNDIPLGTVFQNGKLYYINSKDKNLYSYDIKSNSKLLLSNNRAGRFILNNNYIFYQNLDDNSKLYSLKTDGSNKFKLTDVPVDSFITYNNEILFINTSDNNTLYSLNLSNQKINKVLNINGSNLKQLDSKIYFINNDNSNSIYTVTESTQKDKFEYNNLFSDFTNEYFPTDKGIFIEKASNLDEVTILYNK